MIYLYLVIYILLLYLNLTYFYLYYQTNHYYVSSSQLLRWLRYIIVWTTILVATLTLSLFTDYIFPVIATAYLLYYLYRFWTL